METLCVFEISAVRWRIPGIKMSVQHWYNLEELERHVTFARVLLSVDVASLDFIV